MTADAKVGLLLGLVFIAIIAFVINGLPEFVQSAKDKPVVQTAVNMNTQAGGSMVIEPAVVNVARGLQEKRSNVRYVDPPVDTTVLEQYAGPAGGSVTTVSKPDTGDTVPAAVKTQESQTPAAATQVEKTAPAAPQTVESIQTQKQKETVVASKPQPVAVSGLSHVVEDGESLSGIAKKYYGDQEGNKLSTIQMLYEANKTILESPDAIRAGDQLVIPKMKTAAAAEQTTQAKKEPAPDTLLDKFKNVFTSVEKKPDTAVKSIQPQPVDTKPAPKPQVPVADKTALLKTGKDRPVKPDAQVPVVSKTALLKTDKVQPVKTDKPQPVQAYTEYTVQSGDYLYKIAQKQLGDGNRYPEIIKLNSGLSETDRLKVGTKLKIPKK